MLRPLLLLCALTAAPAAAQVLLTLPTTVTFTTCQINYFGQNYTTAYVSVTSSNTVICFDGYYSPQTSKFCVFGARVMQVGFSIERNFAFTENNVHRLIPAITAPLNCFLQFYLNTPYSYTLLNVAKFQQQAALELFYTGTGKQSASVMINGVQDPPISVTNTASTPQTASYAYLSGCRVSGVAYRAGSVVSTIPSTCTTTFCNSSAVTQTIGCTATQTCNGNGICTTPVTAAPTPVTAAPTPVNSICTVTGPSVIDFHSTVNSVKDRCTYTLLQISSVPGFQVMGGFQERRLTDVSFLDSLWLKANGNIFHVEQGGTVVLNNTPLTLSSSPQTFNGVTVSKNTAGITLIVQINSLSITVIFDGTTAQILLTGSTGSTFQGLCENSSSAPVSSDYSSLGCQTQYPNTDITFIDCINKTDSCYLLKKAPFTSCSIDPQPYITACTNTLSRYPDVDGLDCQFLQDYVTACSLQLFTIPDSWRSQTECYTNNSQCLNLVCSDHEFCGENSHFGDYRCYCRAIFESSYKQRNSLADPTVCQNNTASLTLPTCLLVDNLVDYSVLHLNDPSCKGQVDQQNHTVTFKFNSTNCGTEIMSNDTEIIYKNTIMSQNISTDMIVRHDDFTLDFSCYHTRHSIQSATFTIMESQVSGVMTAGPWTYTVSMRAYVDDACSKAVERYTNLKLNQRVWVKLEASGLDANEIALVTDSCWATDTPSPTATKKYYLIQNGCPNPADQSVSMNDNGAGIVDFFAFDMFRFSGASREIYLHCSLHLCVKSEGSCVQVCSRRRRRRSASSTFESDSFISMGWTH